MRSIRSTPKVTIDLTEDNSTDAVKQQPVPPVAAISPITEKSTTRENARKSVEPATPLKDEETDKDEELEGEMLDSTLESDTEEEEQQETEISQENESVLSAGSTSSLSAVESSPEPSRSAPSTPASVSGQLSVTALFMFVIYPEVMFNAQ